MDFRKHSNRFFWIINVTGWVLLLIITLVVMYYERLGDVKAVGGVTITYVVGFFVSIGLRYLYRRFNYEKRSILFTALMILLISALVSHIWYWVDIGVSILYYGESRWFLSKPFLAVESTILSLFPILVAWSTFYFLYKLWVEWLGQKERAEKADLLAHKAQLQMLRYQLNPHFLFNSLNSIRALVEADRETAREMITELSEFLRYSLISKNFYNVPLKEELEAIKHYFAIQKIRYEERLDVEFDVQQEAEEFPVLSFLIYPLIENAVKYGMETGPLPLKITMSAKVEKNRLLLDITNTGKWVERPASVNENKTGTGTGLENVKQRLENAFPGNYSFEVIKGEDSVTVRIRINKEGVKRN